MPEETNFPETIGNSSGEVIHKEVNGEETTFDQSEYDKHQLGYTNKDLHRESEIDIVDGEERSAFEFGIYGKHSYRIEDEDILRDETPEPNEEGRIPEVAP